jgi:hypothetical protein
MKIHLKDIISFAGRDYVVEGTSTYHLGGKTSVLVRAVDGDVVFWIEAPTQEGEAAIGDRLLVLREVRDLEIAVPPPESIVYHDLTYVQRLAGRTNVELEGEAPGRAAGPTEVWRYRAAGDLYLQIEEGGGRVFMLAGESVHRGMIDVLPSR